MTAAHHLQPTRSRFSAPHDQGGLPRNSGLSGPSEWMTSQIIDISNVSTTTLNYQSLDVKDTILNG